jgi:hypothetical protein
MDDAEGSHLTRPELAELVAGGLGRERTRTLFAHLLKGCEKCRTRLRGLVALGARAAPDGPEEADPYELPVARAITRACGEAGRLALSRLEATLRFAAVVETGRLPAGIGLDPGTALPTRWAWCEVLIDGASARRKQNPDEALCLATLAVAAAEQLPPGVFPPGALADLQARAHMELGNLWRIHEKLDDAEVELSTAQARLVAGTGDPRLTARLLDLLGSLYRNQRHFDEALEALDLAVLGYRACGEPHLAGRSLLKAGIVPLYTGEPEQALRRFALALTLIEPERDPALSLAVLHNLLLAQAEAGQAEKAARLLWQVRRLYWKHGSAADRVRLLGLEAKIALGLGQFERAERLFRRTKTGFEEAGQFYVAAVVGLDLAVVLLERGRPGDVLALVEQTLGIFSQMRIEREAILSVLVLYNALRQGEATAALARQVVAEVRRLDLQPREASRSAS